MLKCINVKCTFCMRDHTGELLCTGEPAFTTTVFGLHENMVVCMGFSKRSGDAVEMIHPNRDITGLYPGQIGYDPNVPSAPSVPSEEDEECLE